MDDDLYFSVVLIGASVKISTINKHKYDAVLS